ncbi:enoyl-CoA hydratase/isomerase family protein [Neptuniibacter sp. PT8_73]|uniref:enoyl-CoA hydratase/isomerase family protein n=1 Tax=unclassified Neptuniibacter TaxID=2630693 RepID=UPI0039F6C846
MTKPVVLLNKAQGVAHLVINKPEVHNAFDDQIISQLLGHLEACDKDPEVRVLVLRSEGKNFSSGADLGWMKRMAKNSYDDNFDDAKQLAALMHQLDTLSKPTICLVQGAAYGGAVGLAACCDFVIATEQSQFCLSEVKIGLIPAVISPYVIRAMGSRQARRYMISAESFSACDAHHYGLVHQVVATTELLDDSCHQLINQLLQNSPLAMAAAKHLVAAVSDSHIDIHLITDTARRIAEIRVSPEGQEGLSAFLEKRKPEWVES